MFSFLFVTRLPSVHRGTANIFEAHFTFAMITQNLNHRETMNLLNDRSIHDDINHVAEKSLMAYLTNIVVSLRVNILSHSRPQIILYSSQHYQGHSLANFTCNISSSAKRGIFLKHLLCRFILVCHCRLVSPT